MSPFTTSLAVFGCVAVGVLLGIRGHFLLPDDHRSPETKEVVRLGMAVVGTMLAMVLGLLVGSGKGFYDTQNAEVTQVAADVVLLDRVLLHFGPETQEIRELMRSSVARMVDVMWARDGADKTQSAPFAANEGVVFGKIQQLSPHDDKQRFLQTQALSMAIKIGQTRSLMFAQATSSVPMPLVTMLTLWLTLLFISFALFVRPNVTVVISLLVSALAVCGAIFLILELYQPYTGWIHVSDAPLRAALTQLGQ
jgi:hypothetical protein